MAVADPVKFIVNPSRFPDVDAIRERTLHELIVRLRELEGDNLIRVVLYGSVARGDTREDSDTDVFVLLREEKKFTTSMRICEITAHIDMWTGECRTHITPHVCSLEEFHDENRYHGFFKNLDKDGVILYDAADA